MKLSIRARLSVIVALFLVPITLMCGLFIEQSFKDIRFARQEMSGVDQMAAVHGLGLSLASADGAVGAFDAAVVAPLRQASLPPDVIRAADALAGLGADAGIDAKTGALRDLATAIGNSSNLILDPDLDSYYVMDVSVMRLPDLVGRIKLVDAMLRTQAGANDLGDKDKAALMVELGQVTGLRLAIDASIKAAVAGNIDGTVEPQLAAESTDLLARIDAFTDAVNAGAVLVRDQATRAQTDLAAVTAARLGIAASAKDYWSAVDTVLAGLLQARIDRFETRLWTMLSLSLAVTFAAFVAAFAVTRSIVKAINGLDHRIRSLADTDIHSVIEGADGQDELSQIARAVGYFRDRVVAEVSQADAAVRREEIVASQKRALAGVAETLSHSVGDVVKSIHAMTSEIGQATQSMNMNAAETRTSVVASLQRLTTSSQDVDSVILAIGQLSQAIVAIADQTARSATDAGRTRERAQTARRLGETLSSASNKIGEVSALISSIASQTNLLALNATIEAARAGEAGKGFAIVASEVKLLADQTGKATGEIERQVQGLRDGVRDVLSAIAEITEAIDGISTLSDSIADTVGAQRVAVQGINANLTTSTDANRIAIDSLNGLPELASASESMAIDLSDLSLQLNDRMAHLETDVGRLLHELTDRRLYGRKLAHARLNAVFGDRNTEVDVLDFSASGMRLHPVDADVPRHWKRGDLFTITMPDGKTLQATIVWAKDNMCGCQFRSVRLTEEDMAVFDGISDAA